MKNFSHIGWVPCLSGRLFFQFVDCGLGKQAKKIALNHIQYDGSIYSGRILVSSSVDWKDSDHDGCVDDGDLTGVFRVFLLTKYDLDAESLSGSVYLAPETFAETNFSNIDVLVKGVKQKISAEEDIDDVYEQIAKSLAGKSGNEVCKVDFRLNCRGFVCLKIASGAEGDENAQRTLIRQAYYYIKYTWHKHRHHNDNAESLTTIHELTGDIESIGPELIGDLKNSLVQLKRDFHVSDHQSLFHARGITSYAKSLVESCALDGFLSEEREEAERRYFDNMADSLQVSAEGIKRDLGDRMLVASQYRAMLVFLLSIVAPVTLIYREDIRAAMAGSDLYIVDGIAKVMSSDMRIFALWSLLLVSYFLYRSMIMRFGGFLVAREWVRDGIDFVVREKYKADILSWCGILLSAIILTYSVVQILGSLS